jgi:hypothetical protein
MNPSNSPAPAAGARNPGHGLTNGAHAGTLFANIIHDTHGPQMPKRTLKTKPPASAIVKRATKAAAPGKKSPLKAPGAGKAK